MDQWILHDGYKTKVNRWMFMVILNHEQMKHILKTYGIETMDDESC